MYTERKMFYKLYFLVTVSPCVNSLSSFESITYKVDFLLFRFRALPNMWIKALGLFPTSAVTYSYFCLWSLDWFLNLEKLPYAKDLHIYSIFWSSMKMTLPLGIPFTLCNSRVSEIHLSPNMHTYIIKKIRYRVWIIYLLPGSLIITILAH